MGLNIGERVRSTYIYIDRISRLRVGGGEPTGAAQELHRSLADNIQAGKRSEPKSTKLRVMTWEPHNCPWVIPESQGPQTY